MSGLQGKIIITTCAEEKADKINILLNSKGATAINFPLIKIREAFEQKQNIENQLANIAAINWLIFSSTNGVKYFFYWIEKLQLQFNPDKFKFAVIGNATKSELLNHNIEPHFVGSGKDSTEFANELLEFIDTPDQQILAPTGNLAMKSIEQVIGSKHKFNKLIVYHTSEAHSINHKLSEMINNFEYDLVLFLSPSAVRSFAKSVSNKTNLQEIKSVPIGITTRQALIDYGTSPVLTPSAPNIETMINELEQYYIQNTN